MKKLTPVKTKTDKRAFYSEHVYHDCGIIYGMLGDDTIDIADFISVEKLLKPQTKCVLHEFISGALDYVHEDVFYDWPDLEIESHRAVVTQAGLEFPADAEKRVLSDDYSFEDKNALYSVISAAVEAVEVPSAFHTLFADRNFILAFQGRLRRLLKDSGRELLGESLSATGTVPRIYIPTWLKKGIFFRDRGECQICEKDISGLKSPFREIHLDHIVPLVDYGNNDPTNFQLVCRECNLKKGANMKRERARFIPYWHED